MERLLVDAWGKQCVLLYYAHPQRQEFSEVLHIVKILNGVSAPYSEDIE
jgi:hypothetical protein